MLPPKLATSTQDLLKQYLDQRILFYSRHSQDKAQEIQQKTDAIEKTLWNDILPTARTNHTATAALVVSGMNDVFNARGYVQAAWWNRIPNTAWALMTAIAVCANILVGFGARNFKKNIALFMIFPFVIAVSFFLIADIDSPRSGVIRIEARNLITLKHALNPPTKIQSSSQGTN